MLPSDLAREWLAMSSIGDPDRRHLGISPEALHRAGGICVARVHTLGATWDQDPAGKPMMIIAGFNGPAPSIYVPRRAPVVVDLIAVSPNDASVYRRTGAGTVLSPEFLDAAITDGIRVPIFDHPLPWLRAGCLGVVLLDFAERRAA